MKVYQDPALGEFGAIAEDMMDLRQLAFENGWDMDEVEDWTERPATAVIAMHFDDYDDAMEFASTQRRLSRPVWRTQFHHKTCPKTGRYVVSALPKVWAGHLDRGFLWGDV